MKQTQRFIGACVCQNHWLDMTKLALN